MNPLTLAGLVFCSFACLDGCAAEYNFDYRSGGDVEVRPVQVFDDGRQTFFQWRSGSADPAILAESKDGLRLIHSARQGSYLVVPMTANAWLIRFGQLQARVTSSLPVRTSPASYKAPEPLPNPVAAAQAGRTYVAPLAAYGAASPIAGDAEPIGFVERDARIAFASGRATLTREAQQMVLAALGDKARVASVTITGRSDGNSPDGLARSRAMAIRDRVVSAGIALDKIAIREAVGLEPNSDVSPSDISVTWARDRAVPQVGLPSPARSHPVEEFISGLPPSALANPVPATARPAPAFFLRKNELIHLSLLEWVRGTGWELVWQHPGSWRALGDTGFEGHGDVTQAISEVVRVLRAEGKPVRLRISEGNKVMEVLSSEVRHE